MFPQNDMEMGGKNMNPYGKPQHTLTVGQQFKIKIKLRGKIVIQTNRFMQ